MSIKNKLLSLQGALFLLLVGIGGYSINELKEVNAAADEIRDNWMPASKALGEIKYLITRYRLNGIRQIETSDPAARAQIKKNVTGLEEKLAHATKQYLDLMTGAEEKSVWDEYNRRWKAYIEEHEKMMSLVDKGNREGAMEEFNGVTVKLYEEAVAALDADIKYQDDGSNKVGNAAEATYNTAFWVMACALVFALTFCGATAFWMLRDIIAPIAGITDSMKSLADGQLSTHVPYGDRTDEIGSMSGTLRVFKDNLVAKKAADEAAADAKVKLERAQRMDRLTRDFEQQIGAIVDIVASASSQLSTTAETVSASAAQTTAQSSVVVAASETASANVHTVASAAEELSGSIREITQQVQLSNSIAQTAAKEAQETTAAVQQLSDMANRINNIVNLINDIAGQTNLLALNATIEAARAGEAGRGFAVVASEVKALAEQTAKATAEIGGQITAIQESTTQTANSIGTIAKTIDTMSSTAGAIAAAVEEQGSATQEIARTANQTSHATAEVVRNITGVREAAESSGSAAAQVLTASRDLARQADALRNQVNQFLQGVRAA